MANLPAKIATASHALAPLAEPNREFVTLRVAGQIFGLPVATVQDVLRMQMIRPIPLAPREVAGSLNLRGRIVTAIDMRRRLGLPPLESTLVPMNVVVEHKNELYSLIVDSVGEVLGLPNTQFETNPANLEAKWREVSTGIFRLKSELLIVLDVAAILTLAP